MALNPLSNPKGVNLVCELCQKPAFIQCTNCRVTYYCGVEHQKADWLGIHEKICQLLIPLRTEIPFVSSEEQRQHAKDQLLLRQRAMIDLTRTTGQKLLFEGKHEEAVPAAMQSLRFSIDVHGLASIELVPSYLILGEASIGLGRLSQAEEYLSQAQWTVLKTPECSNAIKSKLYRNLGLLFNAKGIDDESRKHLANDIYHASEEFGTDDIRTSGGYYYMAQVFYRIGQLDTAKSLFDKVTDIWCSHLEMLIKKRLSAPSTPKNVVLSEGDDEEDGLDEAQEAEAIQVLNTIYQITSSSENKDSYSLCRIAYTLSMLYYMLHDINQAKHYGQQSQMESGKTDDAELTKSVVELLKACDRIPTGLGVK